MTSAQVVETSVTNNSSFQNYPDTRTITLYELLILLGSNHLLNFIIIPGSFGVVFAPYKIVRFNLHL